MGYEINEGYINVVATMQKYLTKISATAIQSRKLRRQSSTCINNDRFIEYI